MELCARGASVGTAVLLQAVGPSSREEAAEDLWAASQGTRMVLTGD